MHSSGPSLPCLSSITSLLNPDKDTNFLSNLINNSSVRANFAIELTKSLSERIERGDQLFKSPKEVEWGIEILGYGFIPPHYQYVKEDRNYLKLILNIYEMTLCEEIEIPGEGKSTKKIPAVKPVLDYNDYAHQKIFLKMLSHLTLLFDKRNFEKKPNPLMGDPRIREEEMKVPIKLCAMAIRTFHRFIFKAYPFLYTDHWEYIIKLLLGLAVFLLQGQHENRFPDRMNVAMSELVFNAWILSGLQNEEIWTIFKKHIHEMINKEVIVSYWTDVCTELTTKLLIDFKCYDPPKLILLSKDEKVEYQENLLIINHNYNVRRNDMQSKNKFTLFVQPFIFNISQEQVRYLWGKMITMMNKLPTTVPARISLLIMKGIRNIVQLLLRLGAYSKPKDEIQPYIEVQHVNEYSIENKRKIVLERDFADFKDVLKRIVKYNKVGPNERKPPTTGQPTPKNSEEDKSNNERKTLTTAQQNPKNPDEEKAAGASSNNASKKLGGGVYSDNPSPKSTKRLPEDQIKIMIETEKEYSWIVKTEKIPSGESLLKLFGKMLFETAGELTTSFEEVRLISVNILCQIFTKASGPFSEATIKKFYQVYLDYLSSITSWNHFQLLLKHSTELFLVNHLPHNIILQKPLVTKLVEYYLKGKAEPSLNDKTLRRSCNKLSSSLLCFFNDEYGLINEIYHYDRNVKDVLYELLDLAFQKDKEGFINHNKSQKEEVKILARSSWNFMVYSVLNYKINIFINKLGNDWFDKSHPLMNNLGIDILLVLGEMCLMKLEECESSSQMTDDIFLAGLQILDKISKFIEQRMRELGEINKLLAAKVGEREELLKQKEENLRLLSSSFGILYTWLLVTIHLKDYDKSSNKNNFSEIFRDVIELLVNYQNNEPFAASIKGIIASLFNRLGSFNFSKNIPFTSSVLINDDRTKIKSLSEASSKLEEKCLLSIGVGDDTILSFYDLQFESYNEVLLFMVRNIVGKFTWFGELFYKLYCPINKEIDNLTNPPELSKKTTLKEEESKPRLLSHEMISSPRSGGVKHEVELLLQQQFELEDQYEDSYTKNKQAQTRELISSETSVNTSQENEYEEKPITKINAIKMFLSNTGILSLKDLSKLTYIPHGEQSKDLLNKIDSISTRCQIFTSIFYVLKPSSEKIDDFPRFDHLYRKFIEELGIVVDESILELGAHESIRHHVTQHKKVLFASNPLYEIVFTLPNLVNSQINLQETMVVPPIIIIWNAKIFTPYESFYPYIINHFNIKDYKTALVITPLNDSYFGINILKKDSDFMLFPPINDFVCSNHMLPSVVIQVITSIHREYQLRQHQLSYHEAVLGKLLDRKTHISSLMKYYKENVDSWELLKAFFESPKAVVSQK